MSLNLDAVLKTIVAVVTGTGLLSALVMWRRFKADKILVIKDRREFELEKEHKRIDDTSIDELIRLENERSRRESKTDKG